jgi:hypothetical protein
MAEEIWYGFCTFWTDDWGQLSATPVPEGAAIQAGIPCCPECGSVGYQIDADEWWEGVQKMEEASPGYFKFIKGLKNVCHGKGTGIGDLWERERER